MWIVRYTKAREAVSRYLLHSGKSLDSVDSHTHKHLQAVLLTENGSIWCNRGHVCSTYVRVISLKKEILPFFFAAFLFHLCSVGIILLLPFLPLILSLSYSPSFGPFYSSSSYSIVIRLLTLSHHCFLLHISSFNFLLQICFSLPTLFNKSFSYLTL